MRRPTGAVRVVLTALTFLAGCSRHPKPTGGTGATTSTEAGPTADASASAQPLPPPSEAVFSAPIAATTAGLLRVAAGLVVADRVIRVRATRAGSVVWTADVMHGATWAPDVDLRLMPALDGVAVLWGSGSGARTMVILGPHGEPLEQPFLVGTSACATTDGIAWVDPHRAGPPKVRARRWREGAVHDAVSLPVDRDPALVCGDHVVFVLGDGDDDLTVTAFVPGEKDTAPPRVALRDGDFGSDDEREHEPYTYGDTLGLVRVGASGTVSMREISRAGAPSPWRTLKHKLGQEDDVVAVDGDGASTLVVLTRDAEDKCPGAGSNAVAVRALRVERSSGAESLVDLAAPDCDVSPGPFWVAPAPRGLAVAWTERAGHLAAGAAPVRRLAVRSIAPDGVKATGTDVSADALADGTCDESGCFAAVLRREGDNDAMTPESIGSVPYP
jgi:hypothetical protein